MKILLTTVIVVCILIAGGLLVGQRFNFTWAGGEGHVAPLHAEVIELTRETIINPNNQILTPNYQLSRGEYLETQAGAEATLHIAGHQIILDQNTEIFFKEMNEESITINLHRGRLLAINDPDSPTLTLGTAGTTTTGDGTFAVVNYHLDQNIKIVSFENSVEVTTLWDNQKTTTDKQVDVHESEKYSISLKGFDITTEKSPEFYNRHLR